MGRYDAVVIGSGPNGLAAAITLARKGCKVLVLEAGDRPGGGLRSAELTLPGFLHDICSAIHPLAMISPFFRTLPLEKYGLEWVNPKIALAHPFDDGTAGLLYRSVEQTANTLDGDREAYIRLMQPMIKDARLLTDELLKPIRFLSHPLKLGRFGLNAMQPVAQLVEKQFNGMKAKAFLAGMSGHAIMELDKQTTSAYALLFPLLGHYRGWPFPRGGTNQLSLAMMGYMQDLGIEIISNFEVTSLKDLPTARSVVFDVTPRQLLDITGDYLPKFYRNQLRRFRYGPGVFKLDWAQSDPIPFKNTRCREVVTFHIGGTFEEIKASEQAVWNRRHPDKPFVILVQHTVADPSRAPEGKHTGWAYCHVPNGSTIDCTERIERQIERFAPGFRETILQRHSMNTQAFERYNANYVGGDINGGVQDLRQLIARPVLRWNPYRAGKKGIYICSSSTPPGGGVHGMCGYSAAQTVLKDMGEKRSVKS